MKVGRKIQTNKLFPWKKSRLKTSKAGFMRVLKRIVFFTKTVLTYCDHEKCLKFEAECREFAKMMRSPEQFIGTVKGQTFF